MLFKNTSITALLKTNRGGVDLDGSAPLRESCDVSYVLFLEPAELDPGSSMIEKIADVAVRRLSPDSSAVHCEILVPPIHDSDKINFATYIGQTAQWQDAASGTDFYLIKHGARWRALPVFGVNASAAVRGACDDNRGSAYSLSMYLTSARLLRTFARWIGDAPRHCGHCATITARVLRAAGLGNLRRSPAWYCPGSLYTELLGSLEPLEYEACFGSSTSDATTDATNEAILTLIHAPATHETVSKLGDVACEDAIRELTRRVVCGGGRHASAESIQAQRHLASALLRWSLLREER